mgnify:FL=1|tara:strand:+ start:407 stop:1231 length:825 start_codon:yes stop_codon:yes gene_type:complete
MASDALVIDGERFVRLACFLIVLFSVSMMETRRPRRKLFYSKIRRWLTNLGFGVTNVVLIDICLPILGVAASLTAEKVGWGIFNIMGLPFLLSVPLYLLLFDLTIYFQHRCFHAYAPLWRFHQMHHSDGDYDSSTGLRFHPVSIFISSLIKLCLIFVMGPPAIAVLVSEIVLNATSIFNHSNWRLNRKMDTVLRLFLVTPDVHRIHHSMSKDEHSCNFGFNFLWWDKIFGTYKEKPELRHQSMHIGIADFKGKQCINYLSLLSEPFKTKKKVNL